jgi:hypothetical protein
LSSGEGWHNNHHADQRSAAHGHRWWELDVTYLTIAALAMVGLVWEVVSPMAQAAGEVSSNAAGSWAVIDSAGERTEVAVTPKTGQTARDARQHDDARRRAA